MGLRGSTALPQCLHAECGDEWSGNCQRAARVSCWRPAGLSGRVTDSVNQTSQWATQVLVHR